MKSCFLGQQVCTGNWSKSSANVVSWSAYEAVLICILMVNTSLDFPYGSNGEWTDDILNLW